MKRRITFRDRFRYWFDNVMSRGAGALVGLLFGITMLVVGVAGIISTLLETPSEGSVLHNMWLSLMHALDAGTLAGDSGGFLFMLLMSLVTLCGLFITSMLIGIINTGLESKIDSLRRGKSLVLERDHVVVLGFNEETLIILGELIEANANRKHAAVVVMADADKSEMEDTIRQRFGDNKTTRIICRSGSISSFADLKVCSIETCRSVIINSDDDFITVKAVLAAASLLKDTQSPAYITAVIHDVENLEAARIAGGSRAKILYFESIISRIMAHSCRQSGISAVFTELFDYGGDEIYIERVPNVAGNTFSQAQLLFPTSTLMGLYRNGASLLNPPADTEVLSDDRLILLAADDGVSRAVPATEPADTSAFVPAGTLSGHKQMLLVIGCSPLLRQVLLEEDKYMLPGSQVLIAAPQEQLREDCLPEEGELQNMTVTVSPCEYINHSVMEELLEQNPESVLVLADTEVDNDVADAKTLLALLHLRNIAQRTGRHFHVTSEMRSVENQELARVTKVNDFVLSGNMTALIMTQVSQNIELYEIFEDLLDEEGSEIYMKPAANYLQPGREVSLYTASAAAAARSEVFIGYKKARGIGGEFEIILNPAKSGKETFSEQDSFIVIAEG